MSQRKRKPVRRHPAAMERPQQQKPPADYDAVTAMWDVAAMKAHIEFLTTYLDEHPAPQGAQAADGFVYLINQHREALRDAGVL